MPIPTEFNLTIYPTVIPTFHKQDLCPIVGIKIGKKIRIQYTFQSLLRNWNSFLVVFQLHKASEFFPTYTPPHYKRWRWEPVDRFFLKYYCLSILQWIKHTNGWKIHYCYYPYQTSQLYRSTNWWVKLGPLKATYTASVCRNLYSNILGMCMKSHKRLRFPNLWTGSIKTQNYNSSF